MQNYQILSALNLNQRLQDTTNPFTPFIGIVDKSDNQQKAAPSLDLLLGNLEKFSSELDLVLEKFPQLSALNALTLASIWGDYLKSCMKSFIQYEHLGYEDELIEKLNALIINAKVEHGLVVFGSDMEAVTLPCHSAMRMITCNNLELSLFLNTGALEIAINSLYAVNSGNVEHRVIFGIDTQKNPETFKFFESFARYLGDVVYDLKWGTEDETQSSPAYEQRNKAINTSDVFALCD